ncbi:unnamed protein product [Fraxinus pennsylvanica]|uniref:Uncharacterized protein n=1 Tax=Fraxinus pennsylvanica TaxID=56036 RepID=A0AAD1YKG3_9LAMI|nr:unnamed protein product [Fraxinus pennsylvanica]
MLPICRYKESDLRVARSWRGDSRLRNAKTPVSTHSETPPPCAVVQSHSTCPLCRDLFRNENESASNPSCPEQTDSHQGIAIAAPFQPTSSSSLASTSNKPDGMLVIDISRQVNEEEDEKLHVPSHLRSLKRLLSGNIKFNP